MDSKKKKKEKERKSIANIFVKSFGKKKKKGIYVKCFKK